MAIAQMKKVTLLATQVDQTHLIEAIQSLQNIELIKLDEEALDSLAIQFDHHLQEQEINTLSDTLRSIQEAKDYLVTYAPQQSVFKQLQQHRHTYSLSELKREVEALNIEALVQQVTHFRTKLTKLESDLSDNERAETFLREWTKLEVHPSDLGQFDLFKLRIGTIETKDQDDFEKAIKESEYFKFDEIFYSDAIIHYIVYAPIDQSESLNQLLATYHFKDLSYHYQDLPKVELARTQKERKSILSEIKEVKKELKASSDSISSLDLAYEYYYNLRERIKAREMIVNTENIFMVSGWTPIKDLEEQIHFIRKELSDYPLAVMTADVLPEEIDDVPILLDNHKMVEPFEGITSQYNLPKYNEIDPTPFYYPFHIIFFGMMSADAGYGLLLWLVTWYALKKFDLSRSMRKNIAMFNQLSIGTIAVGLAFGSFLGLDLPFRLIDLNTQVMEFMMISVGLGIIHILLGYSIKLYLSYRERDFGSFYLDSFQWILMIFGAVMLAINAMTISNPIIHKIGLWLVILNVIGMFIVNIMVSENKFAGFGQGLFGLMDIAGLVGDVVSYTRLTALAISGANIGMAFNLIIGLMPTPIRFTVGLILFVILHALNMFISYLGAYVHDMRLEYVEFFGKFYEGGGRAFAPLRALEKYVWIKNNK